MIEITDLAREQLRASVEGNGDNPSVRIYVAGAG